MTKTTWTFLQGHPPEASKSVIFQLPVVPTTEQYGIPPFSHLVSIIFGQTCFVMLVLLSTVANNKFQIILIELFFYAQGIHPEKTAVLFQVFSKLPYPPPLFLTPLRIFFKRLFVQTKDPQCLDFGHPPKSSPILLEKCPSQRKKSFS